MRTTNSSIGERNLGIFSKKVQNKNFVKKYESIFVFIYIRSLLSLRSRVAIKKGRLWSIEESWIKTHRHCSQTQGSYLKLYSVDLQSLFHPTLSPVIGMSFVTMVVAEIIKDMVCCCKITRCSHSCSFFDILLNRISLVGNQRFLLCVENHLKKYLKASSRSEKSAVISSIVTSIRESSTHKGGGFVRFDIALNRWYEVGDKVARDKVGQALRDAVKRFFQGKKRKENNKTTKKISNALPSIGKVENKSCRFDPDEMYLNFRVHPKKSKRKSKLISTFKKSSVQRKQHNTKNPSVYDGALDSLVTMKTNELVPYLEVLYNL